VSNYDQQARRIITQAVNNLMPLVGRDILVEVETDKASKNARVTVRPVTPMGKAIHPLMQDQINDEVQKVAKAKAPDSKDINEPKGSN